MNSIQFRCSAVTVTCRGPEHLNLKVVLEPVVVDPNHHTVKGDGAAILSGPLIVEVPNERGQNKATFVEGQVYNMTVEPAK